MTQAEGREADLVDVARRLLAEPLTHLMLGNRELFHSNLVAWFFESQPAAADKVFLPLTTPAERGTPRAVHREAANIDLQFTWPGCEPVIIENKVFSLPDEEQLARYAEKIDRGAPALWLLSTADPGWQDAQKEIGGKVWRWLSYGEFARRIREAVREAPPSYEAETMRRYANIAELLHALVQATVPRDAAEPVALPVSTQKAIGSSRLQSVVAKLRADGIAQWMRRFLTSEGFDFGEFEGTITHSQPVNSWYGEVVPGEIRAGWQIQGGTFRLAMIMKHLSGRGAAARKRRFEFAHGHEAFFDFGELDEVLETGRSPLRPVRNAKNPEGFLRFDPDFVYRYKAVPALSLDQLQRASLIIARRVQGMSQFGLNIATGEPSAPLPVSAKVSP